MKKRFKNWLKSNSNAGSFGIAHESLPRSSSMAHESLPTSSSLAQELSPNYNPSDAPQPSNLAENLKISGRFALSVLPRIAGCVDENPAKMAFKFLNLIMQVRTEINESQDELQRILEETLLLLSTVLAKMESRSNPQSVVSQTIEQYKTEVNQQLERITALNNLLHSSIFTQIDYENYKVQLTDISRKVGGATVRFNTAMLGTTGITVDEIRDTIRDDKQEKKLRDDLQPSVMADHRFIHKGKSVLNRETCTEGTRVKILNGITEWANESSNASPPVYWLTGQAGAGKTTIAYTVAKSFGTGQDTVLGANFFCSRQFSETRSLERIVPTLAYQLARICETYRAALYGVDTSDAVHSHNVQEQLHKFLFQPWMGQKQNHNRPIYLVVVDALDEIEDSDRSLFLKQLLRSLQTDNITGLKFLVTSRPDPDIVKLCESFPSRVVCKLQDVLIDEAKQDIGIYLDVKLKHLSITPEFSKLKEQSAGLFIYAATVVKILTGRKLANSEQLKRLSAILSLASSDSGPIDQLYQQVLREAFADLDDDPELLSTRLSILHTFLYSVERISASVSANLLGIDIDVADMVLESLHAVLYVQDSKVYWYHASFPDFIFSHARSNFRADDKDFRFSCDAAAQHSVLVHACFRIMNSEETGLRFNMGDIKSSYLLDSEHTEELRGNVNKNISPALRYACMYWAHHLSLSPTGNSGLIYNIISDFLQLRILFWIEAMHLLGSSGECPHLLHNARNWASKDGNLNLAKDLLAVADFATYFTSSPAAVSTPHLYISSLATWQSVSRLSQSWKDAFSCIPVYKHTGGIIAMPIMTKQLSDSIYLITFSPDGKHVVAGLWSSAVVLNASTGREEYVLRFDDSRNAKQVKFSPNGMRLVIVSNSVRYNDYHAVHLWDASTFQLLHKFNAHRATISIEGTEILTISEADSDGHRQFQVLDISAGTLLRTGKVMMAKLVDKYPLLMGFSSVSMRFIIALEQSVEIWDTSSECAPKKVTLNDCIVSHGAMSPGGKLVAMVTSQNHFEARVFDASTGSRLFVLLHDQTVQTLDFSYDGTRIISVSDNGTLYIWDAATGAKMKVLKTSSSNSSFSVALTRDGSHIGLRLGDYIVQVWSWEDLADVACVTQNDSLTDNILTGLRYVALSDNSKRIMSHNKTKVQVWDATTGTALMAMSVPLPIFEARMSGNGENIICCLKNDSVKVLNATTGNQILHLESEANTIVQSIAISQGGRKFALAKHTQDCGEKTRQVEIESGVRTWRVEIWGLDTAKEAEFVIGQLSNYGPLLTFLDEERYIVAASGDSICICDVRTGNIQKIESEINDNCRLLSINGNGLAVCEERGYSIPCEVWDISSGKRQNRFKLSWWPQNHAGKKSGWIRSLGFSSKGKKIIAACDDGYIRIWSAIANKTVIDVMLVYCAPDLCSIALARDGELVVTASRDGSVQVSGLDDDLDMAEKYPWALPKNGWITSSRNTNHRLMWVSERLKVRQPRSTLFVSGPGYGSVDFLGAMIGEDWEKCHLPRSSIDKSK